MIRGLYIATTGMLSQQRRMDVLTNNLANAETTGYKEDQLLVRSFDDMLIERINDPAVVGYSAQVGPLSPGIHVDEVATRHGEGPLEETNLSTDLALTGSGYFVVNTPDGERYTRSGQFAVSADGFLITAEGHQVQGQDGPVFVGGSQFTVETDGRVTSPFGITQLRLVDFEDPTGLRKEGSNLYSDFAAGLQEEAQAQVRQGFLEGSNVDLSRQMTQMIEIQRSHEINQRIVKMMDERLGKAVNDIGRL